MLQIDVYDENCEFIFRMITRHAEIHKTYTNLYDIQQTGRNMYFLSHCRIMQYCIPCDINHFVIDSDTGIITVYYENGYYFEVTRINV